MTYDPGEREELVRAIEQRQRQIDQAEALRWCQENERRRIADAQPVVTKSAPRRQAATNDPTAQINRIAEQWAGSCMAAVGEVLAKERVAHAETVKYLHSLFQQTELKCEQLEVKIGLLNVEISELRGELHGEQRARERGEAQVKRLRAVPGSSAGMIA